MTREWSFEPLADPAELIRQVLGVVQTVAQSIASLAPERSDALHGAASLLRLALIVDEEGRRRDAEPLP